MIDIKITLEHEIEGTVNISIPAGWKEASISMQRDMKFMSLQKYFKSTFGFYGNDGMYNAYRDWILNIEKLYGPDAIIKDYVYYSTDKTNYTLLFTGEMPLDELVQSISKAGHNLEATFGNSGFWSMLMKRFDTPVDIQSTKDLDGNDITPLPPKTITFASQPIDLYTKYKGHTGDENTTEDCYIATTANITLSGYQTIDGVLTTEFMRILVKNQTDAKQNGLYNASSAAWTRATDANTGVELQVAITHVVAGTTSANKTYKQQTTPVTIGVSNIVWLEYDYVSDFFLYDLGGPTIGNRGTAVIVEDLLTYTPGTVKADQREIEDSFNIGFSMENTPTIVNVLEIQKANGVVYLDYNLDFRFKVVGHASTPGTNFWRPVQVDLHSYFYYKVNSDPEVEIGTIGTEYYYPTFGIGASQDFDHTFNVNISVSAEPITVNPGDLVTVYVKHYFTFSYDFPNHSLTSSNWDWVTRNVYGGILEGGYTDFKFTSFTQASENPVFFIHDLLSSIVERITGTRDGVYSPYLGNPDTAIGSYSEIGCASNFAAIKGLQVRGYSLSAKPHFESLKSAFDGIDPILCLGMGERIINGVNKLFIGHKKEFFDKENVSVRLSWVMDISRSYDTDTQYNKVTFGYKKFETGDLVSFQNSGLDETNTERTWASRFRKIGKAFDQISEWVGAPLTLETVRRSTAAQSQDTSYDNDTFIVSLIKDGNYRPKTGADLDSVSNVSNSDYRYNLDITPGRNFYRWRKILFGCLQPYLGSFYKFTSGKGNYDAVTDISSSCEEEVTGSFSEKQDIEVTNEYIALSELFKIKHILTFEQLISIMTNPEYAIEISQTNKNYKRFFIKDLDLVLAKGTLDLSAWAYDKFELRVVENDHNNGRIFTGEFGPEFT